jgi:hypothetical protein
MKSIAQWMEENDLEASKGKSKNEKIGESVRKNWAKRRAEKEEINRNFSSTPHQ